MKTGRTLTELAAELERQAANKRDFVADTREATMLNGSELSLTGLGEFSIEPLVHDQIGGHLDIPAKFYDRLRTKHPLLLDHTVNGLFRAEPSQRLVRTLDGGARAFLSKRYRMLDNDDVANAALPILAEIPDVHFPSVEITSNRLYIKAVAPRVQLDVKVGDVVQAGVVIRNSEVGKGSLAVERMVFRLVCLNGMITGDAIRRHHVGRAWESEEEAREVFRDDTIRADDTAFFLKVRDTIRDALSPGSLAKTVFALREATESQPIEDPSHGVTVLARRFGFTETESTSILRHLTLGGDLTMYGAIQAVTRAAEDVESYDRSVELETIGGRILELPASEWRELAVV